jgi:hypothetical protein
MSKTISPDYLSKVKRLKLEEQERLLSRMSGKLPRRLEKDKLSIEEALAIQMELEDEQLADWRNNMQAVKAKEDEKEAKAAKKKQD